MCLKIKPGFEARVIFALLGFKTKEAFIYVCQDIDNGIDHRDLSLLWEFGVKTLELENRIAKIIETLKNE